MSAKVWIGESSIKKNEDGSCVLTSLDGKAPPPELSEPFESENAMNKAVQDYRREKLGWP